MRTRSLVLALALCATALSTAAPSLAQDGQSEEEKKNIARTLGDEGQKALDAKNYPRAEQLFRDAEKSYDAATLTLGLARSLAAQGKVLAAVETYNRIIREWGPRADAPAPFKAALETARVEVGPATAKLGTLVLAIEPATAPNLSVTLDDKPFPNAMLGVKRQVNPGAHVLKVSADGFKSIERPFPLAEGASADMKITLEAGTGAAAPVPTTTPTNTPPTTGPGPEAPPADKGGGGNGLKYAAYGAFGLGGAGLIVGSITGIIALGKAGTLKDACNDDKKCRSDQDSAISSYKTMGTISTIGFIVAGVGGAAGAVLLITAPKSAGATWVSPYVGAGTFGATGRF